MLASQVTSRHWVRAALADALESFELRDGATVVPIASPWDYDSQIVMRDKFDMDRIFIVCCGPAAPFPRRSPPGPNVIDRIIRDGLAS